MPAGVVCCGTVCVSVDANGGAVMPARSSMSIGSPLPHVRDSVGKRRPRAIGGCAAAGRPGRPYASSIHLGGADVPESGIAGDERDFNWFTRYCQF